mmetsp:Transcript_22850/g.58213  ORF Transcript_22850/g.58213 Transcript_22850/m.58213 type:complete len:258 (-) Transcript_22850:349-1122(-)
MPARLSLVGEGASQRIHSKLGQRKRGRVHVVRVVPQLGDVELGHTGRGRLAGRARVQRLLARPLCLGAQHHADLAAGVGGDGGVRVRHRATGKHTLAHGGQRLDDVQVQPQALGLRAHDAPGAHRAVQRLEERLLKQHLGGAHRVGGVDDDGVIGALLRVLHKLDAVADVQVHARVVKAHRHLREVLLGHLGNHAVNLGDVDLLQRRVARQLAQHAAVTAAHHQYLLGWALERAQRQVRNHLLVGKLVTVGGLDNTV